MLSNWVAKKGFVLVSIENKK